MLTNITIGQYYPTNSLIHSLDSRLKLCSILVYIAVLFLIPNFWGYLFAAACLSATVLASKIPARYIFRGLKGIIIILLFTVSLNIFFTPGERVLAEFGKIRITYEGVTFAAQMGVRLTLLVIGSSLLTLTTSPIQLTDAIEYLLRPFKKIGVPAHEIAMMMTIALRFIPTLLLEMDKIMKAQMARGADFDTGGIIKKAKSLIPLLVPLFISSFRRADELAIAMEAKCYRGDLNRTKMKQMKFSARDFYGVLVMSLFVAFIIILRFL